MVTLSPEVDFTLQPCTMQYFIFQKDLQYESLLIIIKEIELCIVNDLHSSYQIHLYCVKLNYFVLYYFVIYFLIFENLISLVRKIMVGLLSALTVTLFFALKDLTPSLQHHNSFEEGKKIK
ncbi:hypothetical protein GQX74_007803 [Glossina fuscipes]|nr:hypothetical protein GQX74_007803 [Glossina fuscipes]